MNFPNENMRELESFDQVVSEPSGVRERYDIKRYVSVDDDETALYRWADDGGNNLD